MPKNFSIRNILSTEQLAVLGEIASASAQLESTAGFHLMLALKLTIQDEEAIIAPMNLSTRLDVLKTVGMQRISGKKKLEEFEELMNHLKHCVKQRNIAIHGMWGPEGEMNLGDLMMVMAEVDKPKAVEAKNKNRTFKAAKLAQLAKDLDEGGSRIWDIAKANWLKQRLATDRKAAQAVGTLSVI